MEFRPAPVPSSRTGRRPLTPPAGGFVTRDGETYYRISAFHRLDPFLMTLASDTDLWMFIASSGGLTAGRVDPDGALFPYRTVDQLHEVMEGHQKAGHSATQERIGEMREDLVEQRALIKDVRAEQQTIRDAQANHGKKLDALLQRTPRRTPHR